MAGAWWWWSVHRCLTWLHVGRAGDGALVEGERAVWTVAVVLEVEEQAVAAGRGQLGVEADRPGAGSSLERVDVGVGEVAGAHGDEVAARRRGTARW